MFDMIRADIFEDVSRRVLKRYAWSHSAALAGRGAAFVK